MGGAIVTHGTNKGGPSSRGGNGRTMHTNPSSKGEPIGWGAIKTHCTAMDSVAASRRLNSRQPPFNDDLTCLLASQGTENREISALESALRNRGALGSAPTVLSRLLLGKRMTGRAPSRALWGALLRAPRFLRALSRVLREHFRRFPSSSSSSSSSSSWLPSWPTDTCLEDPNPLKLRSLDSSCPVFLSDTLFWGQ